MFTKDQKDLLMIQRLEEFGFKPFNNARVKGTDKTVCIVGTPERSGEWIVVLTRNLEDRMDIQDRRVIDLELVTEEESKQKSSKMTFAL